MDGTASTTAAALMEMVNILGMSPRCLCPQLFSFARSLVVSLVAIEGGEGREGPFHFL